MANSNGAPKRVSMAYILGFSDKPFKDVGPPLPPQPPPPRHPSTFKQMVTAPGGVIEWTASDGRRGRLTGPGKPRLNTTILVPMPEGKATVETASKEDAADGDIGGLLGGGGLFDDAPTDSDWTKEQDGKLLALRADNITGPWADTAKELKKNEHECKNRFKKIRPPDWMPNNAKSGKQSQGKRKEQNNENNQKHSENRDDERKDEAANSAFVASADSAWPGGGDGGWVNTNNTGATQEYSGAWGNGDATSAAINTWECAGAGNWDAPADNKDGDSKDTGGFILDNNVWGTGGDSGDNKVENDLQTGKTGWDNVQDSGSNNATGTWDNSGGGGKGWDTSWGNDNKNKDNNNATNKNAPKKSPSNKDPSNKDVKQPSNKGPSQSGSRQHSPRRSYKPSISAPTEYELKPDSTFSADDLRLIAKILQQDCQMVWNRVSWRFRDKTGRNLHAEVFEKKVMGRIEERGSERGGR